MDNKNTTSSPQPLLALNKAIEPVQAGRSLITTASPSFVVGIGASAGGLEALERFFKAMPPDSGMAFVVLQHLSPDFKSLMDELLARFTTMAIHRVDGQTELRPNTIFLLSPRKEMFIAGGKLVTSDRPPEHSLNMPIDTFFRSLAREMRDKAIAIVLSGTGTDGTVGLMDVHDMGGLVLAQSEETAKFDGMPRSAIDTGLADAVMAPEEMPTALLAYAKNPTLPLAHLRLAQEDAVAQVGLPALMQKLRDTYDLDFNLYKPATISRRIERRVSTTKSQNLQEYIEKLLHNPEELDKLFKDFLIGVTRFFRDPEAFESLREKAIGQLLDNIPPNEEIRVWVAGCATGEEAYSIGILLLEALEARGREPNVRIFASDMHREALAVAGEGIYPASSLEGMTVERRERFFQQEGLQTYRVNSRLRKLMIFSVHNLIKDPPFTKLDLVTCRNLLIYLQPNAQAKVLAEFHFALKMQGILFLGPSEGLDELQAEFETLDRPWQVYRKIRDSRLPVGLRGNMPGNISRQMRVPVPGDVRLARAYDILLSRYVPTGVLVNERREVMHLFGEVDRFLRPQLGRMTSDAVSMARGDLRIALSSAIQGALKKNQKVLFKSVRVEDGDKELIIDLCAEPLVDKVTNAVYLLLLFQEERPVPKPQQEPDQRFEVGEEARVRIQQLEHELQFTKESLQTTVEELQTSNEELQASNEELQVSNEELQSTNEELHSLNEELYSVNSEFEQKIKELNDTTTDLKNLMQASEIGTIFTDADHRIRLFTPAAAHIFNLLHQDIGRDIRHITSRIKDDDVLEHINRAVTMREPLIKKIITPEGRSFLRRISPYLNLKKEPVGLILTFVEVSALDAAERQFQMMFESAPQPILMIDRKGRIALANREAETCFGYAPGEMFGMEVERTVPERYRENHAVMREAFTEQGVARSMGKHRQIFALRKDGSEFRVEIGLSPISVHGETCVLAFILDITERLRMESEHRKIEEKLQAAARLESLGVLAGGIAHDFNNILTGVLGQSSVLEAQLPVESPLRARCHDIQKAALRASELCNQMLAYSGRGRFVLKNLDLVALVEETLRLIQSSIAKNVSIAWTQEKDVLPVELDETQIRQVVMNLVINAAEAIGSKPGTIQIKLGVSEITPVERLSLRIVPPNMRGRFAFVEVADNGCGISAEHAKRIFEPFFTTKFTGRGLGLAAAQGIVQGHKGGLSLVSEEGRGTTFRLLLPAAEKQILEPTKVIRESSKQLWRRSGTVMVVDDEEAVRETVASMLELHGFKAITMKNGREAVERFAAAPTEFAAIVLDLTMPDIDGAQTFQELRRIDPTIKVLLVSGYTEQEATSRFAGLGLAGFLQKPFTDTVFQESIRAILESAPQPEGKG